MRGLLWCAYVVAVVSAATVTTTATSRISTTVTATKLSTVTSTAVSTKLSTVTSTAVSTKLLTVTSTAVSTKLSTVTSTAVSTKLLTITSTAVSTKLSTVTSTAVTTVISTALSTIVFTATATKLSTTTAPASTVYVTLPASTVTTTSITIISRTTTLPASTSTLPASTITISAPTSYVTLPASTVLSTITPPTVISTVPASTVYVTISASGTNSDSSATITSSLSTSTTSTTSSFTSLSTGSTSTITSSSSSSSVTPSSTTTSSTSSSIATTSSSSTTTSSSSTLSSTESSISNSTTSSSSSSSATSSSTSTSSTRLVTRTATSAPATTPSGTVSTCYLWHIANSWDICVLLEGEFGISAANLLAWNPSINSACSNIVTGYAYCVDGSGNLLTSPTATAPNAVITSIISPCYRYHTITSSDYCSLLQLEFAISFDVLRAWNPSIDNACDNLVIGNSYCVDGAGHNAIPSTASPSTSTSSGTTATCWQYHIITSSDSCTSIQSTFGLTFDLLRVWNTQINNECTNLQTGYSYCVDGSGLFTTVSSSTTSTSSISSSTTSSLTTLSTSTKTQTSTSTSATSTSTGRAVFAHYMVGTMTSAEAVIDVQQAQSMGVDAFALNVATATDTWCINAIAALFSAAQNAGFKLFFSFDMSDFGFPSDFIPLLETYVTNSAYYKYNNLPFVSTFNGGADDFGYSSPNAGWQGAYKDVLSAAGISTFFVPDFSDSSVSPSNMYSNFPVADGFFNWEGSWPTTAQGKVNVSSTDDAAYLTAAKTAGKKFMMGISALQFKHISSSMNYVRRGGVNLALRISQILTLAPDFVEIQTWNDAGEGHYIGPVWNESIAGSSIGSYTWGYDHSGWQTIMTPMLNAYKAGYTDISNVVPTGSATVQGVFWHSTLLSTAPCSGDPLGKPYGYGNLDDTVAIAVLVAKGTTSLTVNVYSGGTKIGSYTTVQGLNAYEVFGMRVGAVKVEVLSSSGASLLSGTGSILVVADSSNCNYNPQVVALS